MKILSTLVDSLSISPLDVIRISRSAPHRYKVYDIQKRSGAGVRTIAQPSRELKAIQRSLIENVLYQLPIHDSSTAYSKGCSILNNAGQHVNNSYLLKMDFSDFFPSIKPSDFIKHINKYSGDVYTNEEKTLMLRLLFWSPKRSSDLVLSIGAPSSPFISNTLMYDFDVLVNNECEKRGVTYTRYADDLAFSTSTPNLLSDIYQIILNAANSIQYPRLTINHDKTIYTSKKHHRSVTGIVLSSEGKLSLGRNKKRLIRSMIYRFVNNLLEDADCLKLRGQLAFAKDIDPGFYDSMVDKYGEKTIYKIKKHVSPD